MYMRGGYGRGGGDRGYGGGREDRGYGGGRDDRGYGGGDYEKPVKEGEEYDVTVEAVGAKGDGVCKVNNFVVFVHGAQQGETVRVRVNKVFKRFAIAELAGGATGSPAVPAAETSQEPAAPVTPQAETEEEGEEEEGQDEEGE